MLLKLGIGQTKVEKIESYPKKKKKFTWLEFNRKAIAYTSNLIK